MRNLRRSKGHVVLTLAMLAAVLLTTAAFNGFCGKGQPKTVANALTTLGNIKRKARAANEITPQQSLDISRKLDAANRSYRQFVTDEQARLAAGTPNPEAKATALRELRSLLNGINDPAVLGFKSADARNAWNAAVGTLNTILAGFGG